jgi:hydroxypyruvate isomerase
MWDERIDYIGRGEKLAAKIRQYGPHNMYTEVLHTSTNYDEVERRLLGILSPATLSDPRCLNISQQEINDRISSGKSGVKSSNDHKLAISVSLQENENALGHVKSEESREQTRQTLVDKKLKWIHNKSTREELQMTKEEIDAGDMLPGFELGRLPKKLAKLGPVPPSGQWRDLS